MAQAITTRLEYLGSVQVTGGKEYSAASFATGTFVGATTFIMKSKGEIVNGKREDIMVSINNTPLFPVDYNEPTAFDPTRGTPLKFKFSQNCIVTICKELPIIV